MNGWTYAILKALALLPGLVLAPALLGLAISLRWRRCGLSLVALSWLALGLFSTPWFASELSAQLEFRYPLIDLSTVKARRAEAIVVLGGGAYRNAPEYNGFDDISALALERVRYAARLARTTGLPLAVTGGMPSGLTTPEAFMLRLNLEGDFGVPVAWAEMQSKNTAENAHFSRTLMPYRRIVLVTHAMHMHRALAAFDAAGFDVIPAPMGYYARPNVHTTAADFLPDMKALIAAHYALYELVGALWYRCCYAPADSS